MNTTELSKHSAGKQVDSVWKRLYSSENNSQSNPKTINLYDEYNKDSAQALLTKLQKADKQIGNGSWQDFYDGLNEGEEWQIKFIQNTDLQTASVEDVMNAGNQARQTAIEYNKSLEQMTFGAKAATIASKALAAAGNMLVFALVAKGIELAVTAISNYINRVKIAEDAMNDAVAAHESAKTSLENINSELETQNTKINELLSKGTLTYVEEDQLKKLQAVTQELLIQQDLAEKEVARTQKEAADKTVTALNKKYDLDDISKDAVTEAIQIGRISFDSTDISSQIADLQRFNQELTRIQNELNNNPNLSDLEKSYLQDNFQLYSDYLDGIEGNIDTALSDFNTYRSNLQSAYDDILQKQVNNAILTNDELNILDTYNQLGDAIKLVYEYTAKADWNNMHISSIFNAKDLEATKEQLISMAKEGALTPDVIESYANLNKSIEDSELIYEDGQSAAQAFCDQIYKIANAQKALKGSAPYLSPSFSLTDD